MTKVSQRYQQLIVVVTFFAFVSLLYVLPIFKQWQNWGIQDWDLHLVYNGVPRLTILEYGQFPLWNPYILGGSVMLAHPESQFLTPAFGFVLLFGEVIGLKLSIWLHLLIGLLGCYALGRYYGLSQAAGLIIAFVFMLNSMFALAFTVGMTWFLPVAFLPWAFLFYQKAFCNWRYAIITGFFLAMMFYTGAAYPFPITLLFFGVYGGLRWFFRACSFLQMARALGLALIFTIGFGAIKFLPSVEFSRTFPRTLYDYSGYSLNALRYSLFDRDQSLPDIVNLPIEQPGFFNGVTAGMDENGIYIGLIPFALFLMGFSLHSKRRMILTVTFLIFVWISMGNRPRAEWWSLLHLLPFYKAMRVAQRFRIIFMLCLAVLTGFGFQRVQNFLKYRVANKPLARGFEAGLLLLVLVDLLSVSWFVLKDGFIIAPIVDTPRSQIFQQIESLPPYDARGFITEPRPDAFNPFGEFQQFHMFSSYGSVYPALLANLGTVDVVTSTPVPRDAVPFSSQNYKGEVYLKGTTGTAEYLSWSPNRLVVAVQVDAPGHLIINQNYYDGWHAQATEARQVVAVDNLLAVPVFPEDREIALIYRPTSFVIGLIVTTVTIVFSLGYGLWLWRRNVNLPAQSPSLAG